MGERWLGIVVSSNKVIVVIADVDGASAPNVTFDATWSLQTGDRYQAYAVMYRRIADLAMTKEVTRAVVKESAVSRSGTTKAHLEAAELRGVVLAALASATQTQVLSKSAISRKFGTRKADEYLSDDVFWQTATAGTPIRIGSREAALVLVAALELK